MCSSGHNSLHVNLQRNCKNMLIKIYGKVCFSMTKNIRAELSNFQATKVLEIQCEHFVMLLGTFLEEKQCKILLKQL